MLTVLDYATIVAGMLSETATLNPEVNDYTEGSAFRSILEACALEIQRQNMLLFQGVREGIETGTYKNFSFNRLGAVVASGKVRFTRQSSLGTAEIPLGTVIQVPGSATRIYTTLEAASFAAGSLTADARIRCQTSGTGGNTSANTIVEVVSGTPIPVTVTNPEALLTGVAQESDAERRDRFRRYIAGLSRGTIVALEAAARSVYLTDALGTVIERVTGVLVREPFRTGEGFIGLVEVYIDNGSGSTSQDLLDAVEAVLIGTRSAGGAITPGWVSAGIDLSLKRVTAQALDVSAVVTILPGFSEYQVLSDAQMAILFYLQGLQVFQTAIHAELVAGVMFVAGVADVSFTTPTANVTTAYDKRITPGNVVVSAA